MKKHSTGSALITSLLVTAIVAVLATLIVLQETGLIKQTELVFNRDRSMLYLHGIQAWATDTLMRDLQTPLVFPQSMPATMFQGVQLSATLTDQMSLFNVNTLANVYNQKQFIRLLKAVAPEVNDKSAAAIAQAISDWILPSNADAYYLRLNPPYRASHQFIVHISELRMIAGITPKIYQALANYVTALPTVQSKININTAPWPVLMTLGDNITADDAKNMAACRQKQGLFNDASLFQSQCAGKANITWDKGVQLFTSSHYFMLYSEAKSSIQLFPLQALMERDDVTDSKGSHIVVKTLWVSA